MSNKNSGISVFAMENVTVEISADVVEDDIMSNIVDDGMDFCEGMPATMSMKGFQSALLNNKEKADCLLFLFPKWKINNEAKFFGVMIYTFLLGVLSESIVHGQIHIRRSLILKHQKRKFTRKFILTVLYGIEQCMGWILMIISMTFSIELFFSVIFGIFVGKILFPVPTTGTINNNNPSTSNQHLRRPTSMGRENDRQRNQQIDSADSSSPQREDGRISNANNDRNNNDHSDGLEEGRISPSNNESSTAAVRRRHREVIQ